MIKVGGKMFALVALFDEPGSVNLKCDPAHALELREMYPGIRPGYHRNKRHWNSVDLDGSVEDDVLCGLTSDSHHLVVAGLPRSIREGLATDKPRTVCGKTHLRPISTGRQTTRRRRITSRSP